MSVEIETPSGNLYFLLDEYMKRYNMSVNDLAELLDKKYNQALNIKNGNINSISFEVLTTICQNFGCEPGALLQMDITSGYNISNINRDRKVIDFSTIEDHSKIERVKVEVHLLFALEDGYIIYASPEVEVYGDFRAPKELENLENATPMVIQHFKDAFAIKKNRFKSSSEFLVRMQQRQHWYFNVKEDKFNPMPLDYYVKNFYAVGELVNKHKALTIQVPLEIIFNGSQKTLNIENADSGH